jgi:isopenicillin N synthase-like dioxygenase
MTMSEIPVIDLAPFRNGNAAQRSQVAAKVAHACETLGFLVVSGHGVPGGDVTALHDQALRFFDRPLEEKLSVRRPRNDQNRGYIPYGEETLAKMHGGVTPPDYKEVFAIGPDEIPDEPYYTGELAYPDFAPNLWPDGSPGLKPAMKNYYDGMLRLARLLADVYGVALDMPGNFFVERLSRHSSQLRLLHYPAPEGELAAGQLRCGVHTDLGLTTILRNEDVPGGLEVCTRDGNWISAPAIADTFVVNIGDLMMRWTNDRWRSTPHRVAVPPAQARARSRRLSIGFFVVPNYDAEVACVDVKGVGAKYPPISVRDYRTNRFAAGAGVAN